MDKILAHRMVDLGAARQADLPVALRYTCDLQDGRE